MSYPQKSKYIHKWSELKNFSPPEETIMKMDVHLKILWGIQQLNYWGVFTGELPDTVIVKLRADFARSQTGDGGF